MMTDKEFIEKTNDLTYRIERLNELYDQGVDCDDFFDDILAEIDAVYYNEMTPDERKLFDLFYAPTVGEC